MGAVHLVGVFFLLASTALLVIVSVSVPVWNSIYFLRADLSSGSDSTILTLGNWGICYAGDCTKASLGYDLDFISDSDSGAANIAGTVIKGLTYALILHPIAAGLTLFALLFAAGSHLVTGILGSLFAFFAFLVTVVAFAIDMALFITTRTRINRIDGASAMLGNAIWLVLAALVLQLLASCTVCFTSRKEKRSRRNRDLEAPLVGSQRPRRNWYGKKIGPMNYGQTYPAQTGAVGQHGAVGQQTYAPGMVGQTHTPVMQEKRHFWQKKQTAY